MNEEIKALFSEKVSAGNRNYFFEVKAAKNGSKYLLINESKTKGEGFETNRILVFEDHLNGFQQAFDKAVQFMADKPKTMKATASQPNS